MIRLKRSTRDSPRGSAARPGGRRLGVASHGAQDEEDQHRTEDGDHERAQLLGGRVDAAGGEPILGVGQLIGRRRGIGLLLAGSQWTLP